jgi:hypothetical protein
MEDNSNKQLRGCNLVRALMLGLHLAMALKMPLEELVDLHMVWLLRAEIYLDPHLEGQVLVFLQVAHNLEQERAQHNNQVSSNSVLYHNLAALEVVQAPFLVQVQVLQQTIPMQILL